MVGGWRLANGGDDLGRSQDSKPKSLTLRAAEPSNLGMQNVDLRRVACEDNFNKDPLCHRVTRPGFLRHVAFVYTDIRDREYCSVNVKHRFACTFVAAILATQYRLYFTSRRKALQFSSGRLLSTTTDRDDRQGEDGDKLAVNTQWRTCEDRGLQESPVSEIDEVHGTPYASRIAQLVPPPILLLG